MVSESLDSGTELRSEHLYLLLRNIPVVKETGDDCTWVSVHVRYLHGQAVQNLPGGVLVSVSRSISSSLINDQSNNM